MGECLIFQNFPITKEGFAQCGGLNKKAVSLTLSKVIFTSVHVVSLCLSLSLSLSLSLCMCVRVLLIYTISIRFLWVLQEGLSLVESNQQIMTSTCNFQKVADLSKVNFCISSLSIQCNTGSCCVHVTGGVNIYLCVSVFWSQFVL